MRKLSFLIILSLILSISTSSAKDDFMKKVSAGAYVDLGVNMHSPSFAYGVPIVQVSDEYSFNKNANSIGYAVGGIFDYKYDNMFTVSCRLGLNNLSGEFEGVFTRNYNPPLLSGEVTLNSTLNYVEFAPMVKINGLLPIEGLYFLAGLEFGFPISAEYETDNVDGAMDIEDASFRAAAALGIGYKMNITHNLILTPELSFRMPFTQVSSNEMFDSWDVTQLRFGVQLTFDFGAKKPLDPAKSSLSVGIKSLKYYDKKGNTIPLTKIKLEDIQYSEVFPLIPYVFCEENQPNPSGKLQSMAGENVAGEFDVDNLKTDAMSINMHTFDIIGSRMKNNPVMKISIVGNRDGKGESGNKNLSMERAEFAKNYLMDSYGISEDRISLKAMDSPEKPSAETVAEGVEENRRMEFYSTNFDVLEPIVLKDEKKIVADPNLIEFNPEVESSDSIVLWKMEISQAGKTIKSFEGNGEVFPLHWVIYPNELSNSEIPLDFYFFAENEAGLKEDVSKKIFVDYYSITRKQEERLPDKTIAKFSLILFDFDNAQINEADMKIVNQYVIPAIKFNSTVEIYGYTDKIGKQSYNKKLAKRRADAVMKILKSKVKDANYSSYGVGFNSALFDNNSPIGRHLSRTVQIWVSTPKE